ncbi:MAG: hypothetical protein A3C43_05390 [Candidatus Schekmanbacteria bacterium RIFCSPHIGHO2_02_FULL_38_11]|uniref:Uncharacterized protein n=1 Tax=Candidatus Schekmanbacteria bacterium RIFCSPLOWO2_12_FULL_38_15 TaxID=1817883 RepID=A0A1F7SCA7_9BACT|nr:MAG: hypothetical protein A2043_03145 [Candidatus Schekmanbacteria bacterium GWA2_38_9]OGL51399.1 MAG: hypothetical protein A3G31_05975 [Candidatus Schekmanbacteria bacterium RIFCSPLOWO2_12_FULL_38_15]OGL51594.1 MAG: hypothetical protein A3H37_09590 [Candidatus Schekmanbacteria bacterium RIFCSPLOWO2_02_FULL_38_14]OGL53217.1 MAG: hypothetical protein A3C43_05390 [Candidatus Schekmanbacteria bacterium RIFCSPHIGHO2_02_FULL_38_11]
MFKNRFIVIASEAKQSQFYVNQLSRDCHVAIAPRNDTKQTLFQQANKDLFLRKDRNTWIQKN